MWQILVPLCRLIKKAAGEAVSRLPSSPRAVAQQPEKSGPEPGPTGQAALAQAHPACPPPPPPPQCLTGTAA